MAKSLVSMDEGDSRLLRAMVAEFKAKKGLGIGRRPSANPVDVDDYPNAPDVYVARTPAGGIPAMDEQVPGTPADDVPGQAVCDLYRLTDQEVLVLMGLQKTVYNLLSTAVEGDTWCHVARDKWGKWWVNISGNSGDGGCCPPFDLPDGPNGPGGSGSGPSGSPVVCSGYVGSWLESFLTECIDDSRRIYTSNVSLYLVDGCLQLYKSSSTYVDECCVTCPPPASGSEPDPSDPVEDCPACPDGSPGTWTIDVGTVGGNWALLGGEWELTFAHLCAWTTGAGTGAWWYLTYDAGNERWTLTGYVQTYDGTIGTVTYVTDASGLTETFDCCDGVVFELLTWSYGFDYYPDVGPDTITLTSGGDCGSGTGSGGAGGDPIMTDCCEDPIPSHLWLTLIGCDCVSGSLYLTYDAGGPDGAGWYSETIDPCNGTTLYFYLWCDVDGGGPGIPQMYLEEHCDGFSSSPCPLDAGCDFDGAGVTGTCPYSGTCCGLTVQVVITT